MLNDKLKNINAGTQSSSEPELKSENPGFIFEYKVYYKKINLIKNLVNGFKFDKHFICHTCCHLDFFCSNVDNKKKSCYQCVVSYTEFFYRFGNIPAFESSIYSYYTGNGLYGGDNGIIPLRNHASES